MTWFGNLAPVPKPATSCRACAQLRLTEVGEFWCGAERKLRRIGAPYTGLWSCEGFERPSIEGGDEKAIAARKAWLHRVDVARGVVPSAPTVRKPRYTERGLAVREALRVDPHVAPKTLAERLGVDDETVRVHLRRMVADGELPQSALPSSKAAKTRDRIRRYLREGKKSQRAIARLVGCDKGTVAAVKASEGVSA